MSEPLTLYACHCTDCQTETGTSHYPLRPGTLDDTSWLRPVGHIWTRSRQPWVALPPTALAYDQQPDDALSLFRAWQERERL